MGDVASDLVDYYTGERVGAGGFLTWGTLWAVIWNVVVVLAWFEALRIVFCDGFVVLAWFITFRTISRDFLIVWARLRTFGRTLLILLQTFDRAWLEAGIATGFNCGIVAARIIAIGTTGSNVFIILAGLEAPSIVGQDIIVVLAAIWWCGWPHGY